MAKLADLLGNAKRTDLYRVAKNEKVPYRGKKKHGEQMNQKELDFLFNSLKSVDKWGLHPHALQRLQQKGIEATYADIVSTIHNATLIEYHLAKFNDKPDPRVILRAKAVVNGHYNLHVVYSLDRKVVVSVWMNDVNDKHATLDWRDYDKNFRIRGLKY